MFSVFDLSIFFSSQKPAKRCDKLRSTQRRQHKKMAFSHTKKKTFPLKKLKNHKLMKPNKNISLISLVMQSIRRGEKTKTEKKIRN